MSEYPCTSLDKAVLKFRLQGGKKSQNVSARFTIFFSLLFGNFCRIMRVGTAFHATRLAFAVLFSATVSVDAVRVPVSLRIPALRIVSRQFLHDLFSIFLALRNYSLMRAEHFALELFGRNSMSIY
ncbi:hypothetical protein [Paraburkholderia hospita]|uniref:hypothetical protein n=1 Tax=Paraburkholderia hospita TaxID=169430 RepID=UPI001039E195|nr:hypothetical protein [Paraburkholderia hospita]